MKFAKGLIIFGQLLLLIVCIERMIQGQWANAFSLLGGMMILLGPLFSTQNVARDKRAVSSRRTRKQS